MSSDTRRVLRKRATARNNVDRGIPSCARAASATSAVTFQPDCRNKSLSTAARRSTSGSSGSFGSTKPDDIASRYSRSTGRSIPFQVYKNRPPVPIWMPRKTVAAKPQFPLEAERIDPILLAADEPHRQKPHPQRLTGTLEDRPGGQRCLFAAGPTPQPSPRHHPWLPRPSAMGAGESLRPAQTTDVLAAGRVVTEAFVHRLKRARVIKASDRVSSGVHQTGVPRPSGAAKGIPIWENIMYASTQNDFTPVPGARASRAEKLPGQALSSHWRRVARRVLRACGLWWPFFRSGAWRSGQGDARALL